MFDDYTEVHNTTNVIHPKRVDHHEHRAPTDDSVRLLGEMQRAAVNDLLAKIKLDNNIFKGVAVSTGGPKDPTINIYWRFNLNGAEYSGVSPIDPHAHSLNAKMEMIEAITRKIVEEITKKITLQIICLSELQGK